MHGDGAGIGHRIAVFICDCDGDVCRAAHMCCNFTVLIDRRDLLVGGLIGKRVLPSYLLSQDESSILFFCLHSRFRVVYGF